MAIWLTDLADWLRAAGLNVIEIQGWRTRARSSGGYSSMPLCVMWHHTASLPSWDGAKDANYIATGDTDAPLSNLYIDRSGTVWVLAAGATNTNGKGGPLTFSRGTVPVDGMNSRALGVEMGNNGVGEPWPECQVDSMFIVSNVCNSRFGNQPADISSHNRWAPTRKIDPATASAVQGPWCPRSVNSSGTWSDEDMRNECVRRAGTSPQPQPPEDDDDVAKLYLIQDSRGAWWATDTLTARKYVDKVNVGVDGINAFGWGGSPFNNPPGQGPWVLNADWQPYVDALPIIGPVPDGAVVAT